MTGISWHGALRVVPPWAEKRPAIHVGEPQRVLRLLAGFAWKTWFPKTELNFICWRLYWYWRHATFGVARFSRLRWN